MHRLAGRAQDSGGARRITSTSLTLFLVSRVVVAGLMVLFFLCLPHDHNAWNRWYTEGLPDAWYTPFAHWDGQHYLVLADQGYAGVWEHHRAFFPLFPAAVGAVNLVLGNLFAAALFCTALFSFGFLWFFYGYALNYLPQKEARRAVILFLLFPTSFFLAAFYTEALFLCCLFGFLYFDHKKSGLSLLFAVLLPLIRAQGFFLLVALVLRLLWRVLRKEEVDYPYELKALGASLLGIAAYFLFFQLALGDFYAGLAAQSTFTLAFKITNVLNPIHLLKLLFGPSDGVLALNNALVDKVFIAAMFALFYFVVKARVRWHALLYAVLVYVPASMGQGGSFGRYAVLAAPLLTLSLVDVLEGRKQGRLLLFALAVIFVLTQVFFVYRFATNQWVG